VRSWELEELGHVDTPISAMRGLVFTAVEGAQQGSEIVLFKAEDGREFRFWHSQDCCESVEVNQVDGDPNDLVGSPLVMAEEETSERGESQDGESITWTFYKFATVKGYVTLRWLGRSNGYYSESVQLSVGKTEAA
jgi:hypothetical protein